MISAMIARDHSNLVKGSLLSTSLNYGNLNFEKKMCVCSNISRPPEWHRGRCAVSSLRFSVVTEPGSTPD